MGASRPHDSVVLPDQTRFGWQEVTTPDLVVVAAHGGAGASTIAGWLDAAAVRECWPAPPDQPPHGWPLIDGHWARVPVLLVCRSHARGLTAAAEAAQQWASTSMDWLNLLGLVVVADAPGRLPSELRRQVRVVAGAVPRTWHIKWLPELRLGDVRSEHPTVVALRESIAPLVDEIPSPDPSPPVSPDPIPTATDPVAPISQEVTS